MHILMEYVDCWELQYTSPARISETVAAQFARSK